MDEKDKIPTLAALYMIGSMFEERLRFHRALDTALEHHGLTREEFIEQLNKQRTLYEKVANDILYDGRPPTQEEIDNAVRHVKEKKQARMRRTEQAKKRRDAEYADLTSQVMCRLNNKTNE